MSYTTSLTEYQALLNIHPHFTEKKKSTNSDKGPYIFGLNDRATNKHVSTQNGKQRKRVSITNRMKGGSKSSVGHIAV